MKSYYEWLYKKVLSSQELINVLNFHNFDPFLDWYDSVLTSGHLGWKF